MMTSATAVVWIHIHWLFLVMVVFGMIASLIWLAKFEAKKDFLNVVAFLLIVGVVGLLVTAPVTFTGVKTAMGEVQGMMDWDNDE